MKLLLLAALLLSIAPDRGELFGTLISAESGELIVDAVVTITPEGGGGEDVLVTNRNGQFTMQIEPGEYWVMVEKEGFRRAISHHVTVRADRATQVNFALKVDTDDVIVITLNCGGGD